MTTTTIFARWEAPFHVKRPAAVASAAPPPRHAFAGGGGLVDFAAHFEV
jgi:hypothetical protein